MPGRDPYCRIGLTETKRSADAYTRLLSIITRAADAQEARLAQLENAFADCALRFGASAFARGFGETVFAPHALTHAGAARQASYQAIAAQYQTALRPFLHTRSRDGSPRLLPPPGAWFGVDGMPLLPEGAPPAR